MIKQKQEMKKITKNKTEFRTYVSVGIQLRNLTPSNINEYENLKMVYTQILTWIQKE